MTFEIWIEQKKKYSYQRMLFVWFQYEMRGWVQTLFHRSITRWKYRLVQQNRAHDRVSEIKSKILLKKKSEMCYRFKRRLRSIQRGFLSICKKCISYEWVLLKFVIIVIYHQCALSYVVLDLCFTRFHINRLDSVSNLQ